MVYCSFQALSAQHSVKAKTSMAEIHPLRNEDLIPSESFMKLMREAEDLATNCQQAEVPNLDHLRMADYDVVYEPSDDTFLMLDALAYEFDSEDSHKIHSVCNVLEIGCGTGVSTIFLGSLVKKARVSGAKLYATDINSEAIRVTKETAKANDINLESLHAQICDLATPLLEDLAHKCDVIIFNPPYVPTPSEEVGSSSIEASWAGGKNGRVVLDRAMSQIANLLSWPHGAAYVIAVDDNKPEEIAEIMMRDYSIQVIPLLRRRARNEFLSVLKFTLTHEIS